MKKNLYFHPTFVKARVPISPGLFLLALSVTIVLFAQTVVSGSRPLPAAPVDFLEQEVTASDGTTNSYFGSAAALNGNNAVIGADGENSFQGAAYIFSNVNGTWVEGQRLTASDGLPGDELGYRVALERHTLVVGAFTATVNGTASQGAAYVFSRFRDTWSESQKLTADDGALLTTSAQ